MSASQLYCLSMAASQFYCLSMSASQLYVLSLYICLTVGCLSMSAAPCVVSLFYSTSLCLSFYVFLSACCLSAVCLLSLSFDVFLSVCCLSLFLPLYMCVLSLSLICFTDRIFIDAHVTFLVSVCTPCQLITGFQMRMYT